MNYMNLDLKVDLTIREIIGILKDDNGGKVPAIKFLRARHKELTNFDGWIGLKYSKDFIEKIEEINFTQDPDKINRIREEAKKEFEKTIIECLNETMTQRLEDKGW